MTTTRRDDPLATLLGDPALLEALQEPKNRYSPEMQALRRALVLNPREQLLAWAFYYQVRNRIPGDYLEFGVYRGESLALAYHSARAVNVSFSEESTAHLREKMHFYGFDTFEGIPAPKGLDAGIYAAGDFDSDRAKVAEWLAENGVDRDRVTLVEGRFDEVLTADAPARMGLERAGVVFIDVDYYESTIPVLDFITDMVFDGSLIIFDDWYLYAGRPDCGEQRAVSEWLVKNPEITLQAFSHNGWSKAFIVRRT